MSQATHRTLPAALRAERAVLRAFARLPRPVVERLGRRAPVNADGEQLAPEVAVALSVLNRVPGSDFSTKPVPEARVQIEQESLVFADDFEPFAVEEDLLVPGPAGDVPATRYRARAGVSRGLVVYLHGGGWVLGSRVSTDSLVRFLAVHAEVDVLSVDYRLAPEAPFPAALEDARAAWDFAVDMAPTWGVPTDRLLLAGDSAGGNLSAVLSLQLRGEPVQPCLQVLFFPVTDLSAKRPSYREFAEGYFLTERQMDWYRERYLPRPEDALDWRASPLLADDLAGAAPAYVAVAGFDPLRDEGLAYAERLREAGVPVEVHRARSLIHAYVNITAVSPDAREATMHAVRAIRRATEGG